MSREILSMQSIVDSVPPMLWTIKYWQWIYSKRRDENPLKTGHIYRDDFICLPCTGGGEDCGRRIKLSDNDARKYIMIPVFASEYSTAEVNNASDDVLRLVARKLSTPIAMEASLDSKPLVPHYIESIPFDIELPSHHLLEDSGAPSGIYRAVSCGYWHKLKPLPKGRHLIKFGGTGTNEFFTKVSYEVIVT